MATIKLSEFPGDIHAAVAQAVATGSDVYVDKNITIDRTIVIDDFRSGKYNQVSMRFYGDARKWDRGNRSVITATFNDAPIIATQWAKGLEIEGLNIRGPVGGNFTGRDSRYSANCGIAFDWVKGTPPPDGGYPTALAKYQGANVRSGSTGCVVRECTISNVVLGIVTSINGYTQNADMMLYTRNRFANVKRAIVGCQAQEKQNMVIDCGCWAPCDIFFSFNEYGERTPGHWIVDGLNLAGPKELITRNSTGFFPMHIRNVFAESMHRIGKWTSGLNDSLKDSIFDIVPPMYSGTGMFADNAFEGSGVNIENTTIRIYGMLGVPMILKGNSINGTTMLRTNQINYANPIKGLYNNPINNPDWEVGYYLTYIKRVVMNAYTNEENIRAFVHAGLNQPNGQPYPNDTIIIFSSMGNRNWAGMGMVIAPDTIGYVSPGVVNGSLYDMYVYKSGERTPTS